MFNWRKSASPKNRTTPMIRRRRSTAILRAAIGWRQVKVGSENPVKVKGGNPFRLDPPIPISHLQNPTHRSLFSTNDLVPLLGTAATFTCIVSFITIFTARCSFLCPTDTDPLNPNRSVQPVHLYHQQIWQNLKNKIVPDKKITKWEKCAKAKCKHWQK